MNVNVKLTNLYTVNAAREHAKEKIMELCHSLNELNMALQEMGIEINQPTEDTSAGKND